MNKFVDACRSLGATAVAVAKSSAVHTVCSKAKREAGTLLFHTGQLVVLSAVLAFVTPFTTVSDRVAKLQQRCMSLMQSRLEGVATPGAVQRHEATSGYQPQEKRLKAAEQKLDSIRTSLSEAEYLELRGKLARASQLVRSRNSANLKASNASLFQCERQLTIASFNAKLAAVAPAAPRPVEEKKPQEEEEETPVVVEADAKQDDDGEAGSMKHLANLVQRSTPTTSALKARLARIFQARDPLEEQLEAWSAAPAQR